MPLHPYIFIFVVMLEESQFYIILLLLLYGIIYCYYNCSPEGIVVLFCNYYKWISLCSKCKWIQCSHPFLTSKFPILEILILNFPLDILHHWIDSEENSLSAAFSYHVDWKMCFFFKLLLLLYMVANSAGKWFSDHSFSFFVDIHSLLSIIESYWEELCDCLDFSPCNGLKILTLWKSVFILENCNFTRMSPFWWFSVIFFGASDIPLFQGS